MTTNECVYSKIAKTNVVQRNSENLGKRKEIKGNKKKKILKKDKKFKRNTTYEENNQAIKKKKKLVDLVITLITKIFKKELPKSYIECFFQNERTRKVYFLS